MASNGNTSTPLQKYLTQLYWMCVLPLVLIAAWLAYNNVEATRAAQDQEAGIMVSHFATAVDQHLRTRTDALQLFAQSPLLDQPDQLRQLYQEALELKTGLAMDLALVETTPWRRVIFNTQAPLGSELSETHEIQTLPSALVSMKPEVGDLRIGKTSSRPIVEIAIPVVRRGRAAYAVVSPIDTAELQKLMKSYAPPAGWSMSLLDGSGKQLAGIGPADINNVPDPERSGRLEAPTGMSRWKVRLEIPENVREAPLLDSSIALGMLVLGATLVGALGGMAGSRRLRRALASLTRDDVSADLRITEIQQAQAVLNETALRQQQSEARFRRLFQDAPIGMRLTDIEGKVLAQNAAFDKMFGYTLRDVPTLQSWMPLAYRRPEEHSRVEAAWLAMMSRSGLPSHAVFSDEFHITTKAGEERVVQVRGGLLADGLLATFIDVTERRQAEASLRLWAEAFKHARLCLAITDPISNTILEANPEFARSCGYEPDEMVGLPVAELFPPDLHEGIQAFVSPPQGESHYTFETEHVRKDGSRFPVLADVTVLMDAQGKPISRLTYATDLTERRRAQAELQALHASLEQRVADRTAKLSQANQELDAFAYSVSHDLRAPLRTIDGYLHVLREEHGAEFSIESRTSLDRIGTATTRMFGLIDGLLTLSKNSRQELQLTTVDLSSLVARRLDELARSEPGRDITTEVQPGLVATGDPRMLEVLMTNLVDNAWKYTARAEAPRIRFFAYEKDGKTWFCVSDNGAGFDPSHSEKLFQPFQRMHRQDEFPGIGIGLATVQRIVQRHLGQIVAEASPGRGATFGFTLEAHTAKAMNVS
jgi:PAS domain S-box-containing protein